MMTKTLGSLSSVTPCICRSFLTIWPHACCFCSTKPEMVTILSARVLGVSPSLEIATRAPELSPISLMFCPPLPRKSSENLEEVPRIWEGEGYWRSEILNPVNNDYCVRRLDAVPGLLARCRSALRGPLSFDLQRNYYIKNVVLFEEDSILPLPECLESSEW